MVSLECLPLKNSGGLISSSFKGPSLRGPISLGLFSTQCFAQMISFGRDTGHFAAGITYGRKASSDWCPDFSTSSRWQPVRAWRSSGGDITVQAALIYIELNIREPCGFPASCPNDSKLIGKVVRLSAQWQINTIRQFLFFFTLWRKFLCVVGSWHCGYLRNLALEVTTSICCERDVKSLSSPKAFTVGELGSLKVVRRYEGWLFDLFGRKWTSVMGCEVRFLSMIK